MYLVLLVIHIIVTLALIGIILVQRSAADGLGGMGGGAGGGGGGFMTARGQANLMTRTTAILAAIFILNSLALSWLTQQDAPSRSLADDIIAEETISVPLPDNDLSDSVITTPATEVMDGVKDAPTPEAPKADSTEPKVPTPE